jgi:chemotaxis protein CheD
MHLDELKVGIGDYKISTAPSRIITVGLGSCIGIAIYDKRKNLGGLAHIMLPDSTQFSKTTNPLKFANLAVVIMVEDLVRGGACRYGLTAKIAGGASMFNFSDKTVNMDIGYRNGLAVKEILSELRVPLLAMDIGGNKGRTIIFDTSDGVLYIKTAGMQVKQI